MEEHPSRPSGVSANVGPSAPVARFSGANVRAAWWALRAARRTRLKLRAEGLERALAPPPPRQLPPGAVRGVRAVLRRRGETCLVRSIVMQSWLAAHGEPRDLIIGVRSPTESFGAHAWLEGEPSVDGPFRELARWPAR